VPVVIDTAAYVNLLVSLPLFLDPEGGSQNATLVVVVVLFVLEISSVKISKAFLICSGAQQTFAYIFGLTFPTDLPPQIFKLTSS